MFNNICNFFDIMNSLGVGNTSKHVKQPQILEWLEGLSVLQLKSIVQIKNPKSKVIVEKIINNQNYSKIKVLSMGFSEHSQQDIYFREEYRFKKDKQNKKKVASELYDNLTVSRSDQLSVGVSKEYIEMGSLREAMQVMSETKIFFYIRKQFHSFAEWIIHLFEIEILEAFEKQKTHSVNPYAYINTYEIEQIEIELKKAIISVLSKNQKGSATDASSKEKQEQEKKYLFGKCWDRIQAERYMVIAEYNWLEEDRNGQFAQVMDEMYKSIHSHYQNYQIEEEIKEIERFEKKLNTETVRKKKNKRAKKRNKELKKNQNAEKHSKGSSESIEEKRSIELKSKNEQKQQFHGLNAEKNSKVEPKKKQQSVTEHKTRNTLNNKKATNTQLKSSKSKSQGKRKYIEKREVKPSPQKRNSGMAHSDEEDSAELHDHTLISEEINFTKIQKSQSVTDSTYKLESTDKKTSDRQAQNTTLLSPSNGDKFLTNESESQSSVSEYDKLKPKSKSLSKQSLVGVSMKKIDKKLQEEHKRQKFIDELMGQTLSYYASNLIDDAKKTKPKRTNAIEVLNEYLETLDIQGEWQLAMFGSCEVEFELKQSDVDIVLKLEKPWLFSLQSLALGLKLQKWVLELNQILTAEIPIITLKINLLEAGRLSNRLKKKIEKAKVENENFWQYSEEFIVSVDISLCGLKQEYQGIVNTNNMRFMFHNSEYMKKVSILIKDLLRKKSLNKPYYGGINSYVLAMMLYGIIKRKEKQIEASKSKHDNEYVQRKKNYQLQALRVNIYVQVSEICAFLKEFTPGKTLINPLDDEIQPDSEIHLNIVDPFSKRLVKTSAFRIYEIIDELLKLKAYLETVRDEVKLDSIENKKYRKEVYEKVAHYLNGLEPTTTKPEEHSYMAITKVAF